jgi:hypothetical protein
MNTRIAVLSLFLAVCCIFGRAQTDRKTNRDGAQPGVVKPPIAASSGEDKRNSGPLAWVKSDVNPKTVFWIQGRFIPVDETNHQGNSHDAEVVTILCSIRENECLEIESTSPLVHGVQVWIEDFKPVNWDDNGILATTRSLDGCTDETLRILFSPPSVVLINSPVLPVTENCKKVNGAWDKLLAKNGSAIAAQTEQDQLVPTRGLFRFQDWVPETGKSPSGRRATQP